MMTGWTIYDHPLDYPDSFVARKWITNGPDVTPTDEMFTADTIEELRQLLPRGLHRFPRQPSDHPCIVEAWL